MLPVGDGAFVGGLGVFGDLAFDRASLLAVDFDALTAAAVAARVAGFELNGADLLGQGGGEGVGVVLFAGEEVPEQLCHLGGGGDDRDRMTAPAADAEAKRAQ